MIAGVVTKRPVMTVNIGVESASSPPIFTHAASAGRGCVKSDVARAFTGIDAAISAAERRTAVFKP
jgi:hypothetical protein